MSTQGSAVTTDHDKIRKWAEKRGGKPAHVKSTGQENDPGLLRIDFPDGTEEALEQISWDEFFRKFEEKKLAFLYQEDAGTGNENRFNKFVSRNNT